MPNIRKEKRDVLDPIIEDLFTALRGLECDYPEEGSVENSISYILSQLLTMYSKKDVNNALGMLFASALELHNRLANDDK